MKVTQLFEAPSFTNTNSASVGYDNRGDYPSSWDDDEFSPEDNGFEKFQEVWKDIEQRLLTGNTLKGVAAIMGISVKEVYNEFRKAKRYAIQTAKQQVAGGDLYDVFYDDHATSIFNVLTHADDLRWKNPESPMVKYSIPQQKHNADYVEKCLKLLYDDRHMYDYESAKDAKEADFGNY